jgi:ribosomal protein S18 acetylase RimI-like enzyme
MLSIRRVAASDGAALQHIARAAYGKYLDRMPLPPAPLLEDYDAIARAGEAWVAEADGDILGFIVTHPDDDALLIENVAVSPTAQGGGVGSALLAQAQRDARAAGFAVLRLYTNEVMTENLEYYVRRGFRETHRERQDGYNRVFFERVL